MTTAGEIMHRGAQWIPAHETLDRAAQLMRELNVGALPISDKNERLCGILTDRDIVVGCVAMGRDPSKVTAGEMAQGTPRWIDAGADVSEVIHEMQEHQIRRLPVIENKRLVGMISEADLAQHLTEGQIASWAESVYARTGSTGGADTSSGTGRH
jgi:CBS domain-containing protein